MTFDEALGRYLKNVEEKNHNQYIKEAPLSQLLTYTYTKGSRFIKIIEVNNRGGYGYRCAYSFIEKSTGDIYKAASWRAPANGARGNIYNDSYPILFKDLYK